MPHMNIMQKEVKSLCKTEDENLIKVNDSKTKVMLFNSLKKTDCETLLVTPNGNYLEYVSESKLLGTILTEGLKAIKNTQHMVKKHTRECG